MKLNWNFLPGGGGGGGGGGEGVQYVKPSFGGSMDIFWNCTMLV